jgi:hypothetical protein
VLSQLSYTPGYGARRLKSAQFEKRLIWWAWEDSNFRPHAYQACALTD